MRRDPRSLREESLWPLPFHEEGHCHEEGPALFAGGVLIFSFQKEILDEKSSSSISSIISYFNALSISSAAFSII